MFRLLMITANIVTSVQNWFAPTPSDRQYFFVYIVIVLYLFIWGILFVMGSVILISIVVKICKLMKGLIWNKKHLE